MAKIKAKFRRRNGVPYAIETFSGRQFRCRHCNEIFHREKDIDLHLRIVAQSAEGGRIQPHRLVPRIDMNVVINALYVYDVADRMHKQWLKMKKTDTYDGM